MTRRKKQNRKKNQPRISFPSPLAAILLTVATLSLSYLWLCGQCESLGSDITGLEKEKKSIQRRVLNEEFKWSNMKSPRNMEGLLAKHDLHMILPSEPFVVRVRDPHATDWASKPQFAQAGAAVMND